MCTWEFYCHCFVMSDLAPHLLFRANISTLIVQSIYSALIEEIVYLHPWNFRCISHTVMPVLGYKLNKRSYLFQSYVTNLKGTNHNLWKRKRFRRKNQIFDLDIGLFESQWPICFLSSWTVLYWEHLASCWKEADSKPTIVSTSFKLVEKCKRSTTPVMLSKWTWFNA